MSDASKSNTEEKAAGSHDANPAKPSGGITEDTVASDYRILNSSLKQLDSTTTALEELAAEAPWRPDRYFDTFQHDRIEGLFFRFLVCRRALADLAFGRLHLSEEDGGSVKFVDDSVAEAKSTMIAFDAAFSIALYDGRLVGAFQNDEVAVSKLNEEFYRSRIPHGTFETLLLGVTDEERLKALGDALLLYTEEAKRVDALTSQVIIDHAEYRRVFDNTRALSGKADDTISEITKGQCNRWLSPSVDNKIRHSRVAELTRSSADRNNHMICTARAHLFKGVSRLKSPASHLIRFTDEQKSRVTGELLRPGDIILTYTAGYMSDVFIPGAFKHGITYVGSVEDRAGAGLVAEDVPKGGGMPDGERDKLIQSFGVSKLASGQDAEVIEAVAEGVIFNNLGHLMDTHINRMVVLRPLITAKERTEALTTVFRFLGAAYDFGFNFADASTIVCTELIYRAFDGKGELDFKLVQRAGHPTLSADDIVNFHLATPGSFEFVLIADEDPQGSNYEARILVGDSGKARLSELMAAQKKKRSCRIDCTYVASLIRNVGN